MRAIPFAARWRDCAKPPRYRLRAELPRRRSDGTRRSIRTALRTNGLCRAHGLGDVAGNTRRGWRAALGADGGGRNPVADLAQYRIRSDEHTSELQSLAYLVCRLLLEKKKFSQSSKTG